MAGLRIFPLLLLVFTIPILFFFFFPPNLISLLIWNMPAHVTWTFCAVTIHFFVWKYCRVKTILLACFSVSSSSPLFFSCLFNFHSLDVCPSVLPCTSMSFTLFNKTKKKSVIVNPWFTLGLKGVALFLFFSYRCWIRTKKCISFISFLPNNVTSTNLTTCASTACYFALWFFLNNSDCVHWFLHTAINGPNQWMAIHIGKK